MAPLKVVLFGLAGLIVRMALERLVLVTRPVVTPPSDRVLSCWLKPLRSRVPPLIVKSVIFGSMLRAFNCVIPALMVVAMSGAATA